MADIVHDFPIKAPADRVFEAVSTPLGLDCWWTKTCAGRPAAGAEYALGFGPGYDWRARVAIYLRILRRHLEEGEFVPYEARLDA